MSEQAQARRRLRSAAGTGWSFLVVVSCGRSTNDHLRVPECRTVSGFRGRAETATYIPTVHPIRSGRPAVSVRCYRRGPCESIRRNCLRQRPASSLAAGIPSRQSSSNADRATGGESMWSLRAMCEYRCRLAPPTLCGPTRRGRRPARRQRSLSTTACAVAAAGAVPSAGRCRPAAPPFARWSSRLIGWGGGAGAVSGPGRRARVSDLRPAGINGSMDDPDANDEEAEEVVSR